MDGLTFTKKHTEVCKGLAVLLLLWHHLYYMHPEQGWFVYHTAVYAKVCVHIFLILSGYGLFFSMRKRELNSKLKNETEFGKLFGFYKARFLSLMPRYWIIFILGVGISMVIFHKMPEDMFKKTSHPWIYLILQFFGLHMIKNGGYGYNPTWWYMTTIIMLYIVFPYIYKLIEEYPITSFLGLFIYFLYRPDIPAVGRWGVPFIFGVFLAKIVELWTITLKGENDKILFSAFGLLFGGGFVLIIIFIFIPLLRNHFKIVYMTVLGFELILIGRLLAEVKILDNTLAIIGKHSYNIFLIHTFINFWLLFKFIYKFRSSLFWSLPLLLCLSLACSIIIECIHNCLNHGIEYLKHLKNRI